LGRRLANREQAERKIGALEGVPAMGLDGLDRRRTAQKPRCPFGAERRPAREQSQKTCKHQHQLNNDAK